MTTAIVRHQEATNKYELVVNGVVEGTSKHRDYFEYHLGKQDSPKLNKLGITKVVYADEIGMVISDTQGMVELPSAPVFSINERFEMMDQLIEMTVRGSSKSMVIAGRGGIGKSFAVQGVLQRLGKVNVEVALAEQADAEITDEDSDGEIGEKVAAMADLVAGDYKIIKGYASPSALYRILYENRKRIVIFDDCDSVLRDDDAVNVLKSALDSYEERWVSWNINAKSDLPPCFRFEGQVIFITNLDMNKVDEAIRTRAFKVDVSMTKAQRVERMEAVLGEVMPEVELEAKQEALDLLKEHMHLCSDINFRALMNVIKIRTEAVGDWRKLATFTLTQG
jgi:hypothetical protein